MVCLTLLQELPISMVANLRTRSLGVDMCPPILMHINFQVGWALHFSSDILSTSQLSFRTLNSTHYPLYVNIHVSIGKCGRNHILTKSYQYFSYRS